MGLLHWAWHKVKGIRVDPCSVLAMAGLQRSAFGLCRDQCDSEVIQQICGQQPSHPFQLLFFARRPIDSRFD